MSIISLWQIIFKYVFFFTAVFNMITSCIEESSERKKESKVVISHQVKSSK